MLKQLRQFCLSRSGNIGTIFSLGAVPIMAAVGAGMDYSRVANQRSELQVVLDSAVLAGVNATGKETATAASYFNSQSRVGGGVASFSLSGNELTGSATATVSTQFMAFVGTRSLDIKAQATAVRGALPVQAPAAPCILALSPSASQALLVNSGARIAAPECEVHVRSNASPAAIFNAGTTMSLKKFCIQGNNIIRNSGDPMPIETGCSAIADPYVGRLPTPSVGACANSQNVYDPPPAGAAHIMPAGSVWCDLTFNGSPRIVFQPGLHIIKGRMIVNANATIEGTGVTFYFPDLNSELRANGGISSKLSAPTSGPYANILMFEPSTGSGTTQYVFNSSVSEEVTGLIYLPRRDLTYNSTSTVAGSKIQIVGNTIIFNSLDWRLTPNAAFSSGASGSTMVRLTR